MVDYPTQGQTPWGDALNRYLDEYEATVDGRLSGQDTEIGARLAAQDEYIATLEADLKAPADTQVAAYIDDPNSLTNGAIQRRVEPLETLHWMGVTP